ncbi:hypothetical protein PoB_001852800 [Plakobranchus ocellatus]|uniref:Uncharacterized protein n=1 Tax=Plakobranchus ocellatus TaxID=259542 RepID=A0AAV3ZBP6_9GAST|nr:hypothetical protein PoB_001852800 [Plakobranchus ocellatus]
MSDPRESSTGQQLHQQKLQYVSQCYGETETKISSLKSVGWPGQEERSPSCGWQAGSEIEPRETPSNVNTTKLGNGKTEKHGN